MLFLIDLPRKAHEAADDTTPFRDELVYFLRASKLNEKIIEKMLQFDFSNTTKYAFVHSMWVFLPSPFSFSFWFGFPFKLHGYLNFFFYFPSTLNSV